MQARVLVDSECELGEGPLWHPDEQQVYWTDIRAGEIHRYDPASETHELYYHAPDGEKIGGFTFQEDGSLLLFMTEGRVSIYRDGALETVVSGLSREAGMRFNDVIADPRGRVFCGTTDVDDPSAGRLYRLDTDGTLTTVLEHAELPNGMGFTPDRDRIYVTESNTNTIHLFDYDADTGRLDNRRTFAERTAETGIYDGLTVDADGAVWSALWDGGSVVKHTTSGGIDRQLQIPATNVTSLAFGGDDLTDLYVTTAAMQTEPDDTQAGNLFGLNPGAAGKREFTSAVQV